MLFTIFPIYFVESLKLQRNAEKYTILRDGATVESDRDNFGFTKVWHFIHIYEIVKHQK